MRWLRHSSIAALLSFTLVFLASPAAAQEQNPQGQQTQSQGQQNQAQTPSPQGQQNEEQPAAPIPAYHSPLASAAGDDDSDQETEPMTPDTRPLAGAQNLSLGSLENNHNYWQPHIDISESVVSNPQESPNQSGWGSWLSLSGGADVHRTSGYSELTLNYLGGGMISTDASVGNGIVQELGVVDKFTLRRWTLSLMDQVSYLPGAAFGFGGLGNAGFSTGGSIGLGTTLGLLGQTALTGLGQTIENAFVAEADVKLTPRTSLTFFGGDSLVRYSGSDLADSNAPSFRGGYNYLLTPKDTVAVLYTYVAIRYSNYNQSINTHTIQGSYARRVTGRLTFQVAAGPQIAQFREPITSGSGASGSGGSTNSSTQLYWSLSMNTQYQFPRTGLTLSYNHGVSAGSGVLTGSVADVVSGSITRKMSRTFSSGLTAGYSRNNGLAIGSATTPANQTFDYWFAGATFSHPMGRTLGLTFSYQMQYQNSNSSFCVASTCGTSLVTHIISIGVGWHQKPLSF